ncbi:c-type cytochrome [Deinococcus sp. A31D244]|uniref:c-type cytochrome n=1 Tax=Deinococcus sp. A31D244 TaxID=3397675 RepID=UPI0039E0CBB1
MNRRTQREAGDVMSWAVGVTAGLILGVTLLIATPQLMKAPQAETTKTGTTATTMPETATQSMTTELTTAESTTTNSTTTGATMTPAPATDTAATTDAAPAGEAAAGDPTAGQTVFAGNCAGCHGANAQGQIGPSLVTADGPKAWTDAQFLTSLREGKTPQRELSAAMPRFAEGQISDADVANIHAYLKTLN